MREQKRSYSGYAVFKRSNIRRKRHGGDGLCRFKNQIIIYIRNDTEELSRRVVELFYNNEIYKKEKHRFESAKRGTE